MFKTLNCWPRMPLLTSNRSLRFFIILFFTIFPNFIRFLHSLHFLHSRINFSAKKKTSFADRPQLDFIIVKQTQKALVVFNNFLLIDATDRSKINSAQKRFFIALSIYPLSFFSNTPFKNSTWQHMQ